MSYSSGTTVLPLAVAALIRGPIVACLTFSSIRITTSPPRCNIPKIGGFSLAKVPRPRSPFRRRRRGGRPFFWRPRDVPYVLLPHRLRRIRPRPPARPEGDGRRSPRGVV